MNIRKKLTIQFVFIVTLISILSSTAIYYFSSLYRTADFTERMLNKSTILARMLIEIQEVNPATLAKIENNNPLNLPKEKIRIYNYKNFILYSSDTENILKISPALLDEIRLKDRIRIKQGDYEILGY